MSTQTSMLHVHVDNALKERAADPLAQTGVTLSDAVRFLLSRNAAEGGLPEGLTTSPKAHGLWFRAKVLQALEALENAQATSQADVMAEARALIASKRRA